MLGTDFASDGYVWAAAEVSYLSELGNGVALELYKYEAGFRPGVDQTTTMCRQRFRLVPSKNPVPPNQPPPQIDPSLFIVHYKHCEQRMPAQAIPPDPRINNILQTRAYLQRAGQILQKEFMLSDRQNWPQLPFPSGARHPMFGAAANSRAQVHPEMAYPTSRHVGPPAKRQRQQAPPSQHPPPPVIGAMPPIENTFDDEEDVGRGDMFDQVSPRELAIHRFQQNHEWLEEVLSSPYRIGQIELVDLGLGLKGELSPLSESIFTAQGADALHGVPQEPCMGRLNEGKIDIFRKRVTNHISSTKSEIERMKVEHETTITKFKSNSLIMQAERELRFSVDEIGPELWCLEGRIHEDDESSNKTSQKSYKTMNDIVALVESALGRHAQVISDVKRVQDGGYQEPEPESESVQVVPSGASGGRLSLSRQPSHAGSQHSGLGIGDSDIEMGGMAGSLLDQINPGGSAISTPNNFPTPQAPLSTIPSAAGTPAHVPSPHPMQQTIPDLASVPESSGVDSAMSYTIATVASTKEIPPAASDQGTGSGDWVVVPKSGSPSTATGVQPMMGQADTLGVGETTRLAAVKPPSAAGTPADDFSSLADLDTAGEVMETLNNPDIGTNTMDLDMEDTNFGDAFHGIGGGSNGDTPGDGL